jgi:membrane-bound serine protease (ClpP class)
VGTTAGLVIVAVSAGLRALYRPASTGAGGMVGQVGVVQRALDPEGQVLIDGELWRAVASDGPVPPGESVEVARMDGLTLTVTRKPRQS